MEKFFEGHISKAAVSGNIAAASFSGRLNASSGKGGDYEKLSNKPRINGVILSGDKSFEELGFPDIPDMTGYARLSDIPSSLPARGGDADTVGGHTVLTDVPENAVFTDTVPDLSGYAKLSDIPSSLPARGGNADTVGGRSYDEIKNTAGTNILTVPDTPTDLREWIYHFDSGIYVISYDQSNIILPANIADGSSGSFFIIDWKRRYSNDIGGYDAYYGIIELRSLMNNNAVYQCAVYNNTGYSDWKEISAAPIRSTTASGTTDNYGNVKLWSVTDSKIPIAFLGYGCYIFVFPSTDGFYYAGIWHAAGHTAMANTAVSGTVYYIEQE